VSGVAAMRLCALGALGGCGDGDGAVARGRCWDVRGGALRWGISCREVEKSVMIDSRS
jgi:hypothetical protein